MTVLSVDGTIIALPYDLRNTIMGYAELMVKEIMYVVTASKIHKVVTASKIRKVVTASEIPRRDRNRLRLPRF